MHARSFVPATVLLALVAPSLAGAEGLRGRFAVAFQVGTQSELGGDLTKGGTGSIVGKPATIEAQGYRDVYAPDLRLQAVLGYGVGERVELFVRGTWYEADGTTVEVGDREGLPVYAEYGPYEERGVEAGLRFYISATSRLRSYVGPVVGARVIDEILVSYSVPEAGYALRNVPLTERSTVPVFGVDLGFSFDLGEHAFVGIDTSLRYQGEPSAFGTIEEVSGITKSEARWTAPVAAFLGFRF